MSTNWRWIKKHACSGSVNSVDLLNANYISKDESTTSERIGVVFFRGICLGHRILIARNWSSITWIRTIVRKPPSSCSFLPLLSRNRLNDDPSRRSLATSFFDLWAVATECKHKLRITSVMIWKYYIPLPVVARRVVLMIRSKESLELSKNLCIVHIINALPEHFLLSPITRTPTQPASVQTATPVF